MAELGEIHPIRNYHNLLFHRMLNAVAVQGGNHGLVLEIVEDVGFVVGDAVRLHPHHGPEERESLLCPPLHPHGKSILVIQHFRNPAVTHVLRHPEELAVNPVRLHLLDDLVDPLVVAVAVEIAALQRKSHEKGGCHVEGASHGVLPQKVDLATVRGQFAHRLCRHATAVERHQVEFVPFRQFPDLVVGSQLVALLQREGDAGKDH